MESQKNSRIIKGKNPVKTTLVFHHAGGNSAHYKKLLEPLLDHTNLVLIDLPGRFKETDSINLGIFINELYLEIKSNLDHEIFIFGHSMGALTGFEFARYLIAKGYKRQRISLILSGYQAPHLEFRIKNRKVSEIEMAEFREYFGNSPLISEEIKRHEDFFDYFMKILKRDLSFLEDYQYKSEGPVPLETHLFIPMKDSLAPKKNQLRWSEIFQDAPAIKYFEGDHFYLFEKPQQFVDKLIDITKKK